jgi:hypothetical protein
MSRVVVDYSRFPLIIQSMRFGYTQREMEEALARYVPFWEGERKFALAVWQEPGVAVTDASMRAMMAAVMNRYAEGIRRTNLVTAIVMPERSYRIALTALNWLSPPNSPQRACASILEAVDHCCEVLEGANIPLNPAIHAFRDELRRGVGYVAQGIKRDPP